MSHDTDNNFWVIPESDRTYEDLNCDPRATGAIPANYDDLLKGSAKRNVTVRRFVSESDGTHKEDGIDLNNECDRIVFEDGRVGSGRGVAVTIKGGSCNTELRRIVITRSGRHCDIEIGNHSDQSWKISSGTLLEDVVRADGEPVRVAWGRGSRPTIIGGNVKINWSWTVALHVYVYAKHFLPWIP